MIVRLPKPLPWKHVSCWSKTINSMLIKKTHFSSWLLYRSICVYIWRLIYNNKYIIIYMWRLTYIYIYIFIYIYIYIYISYTPTFAKKKKTSPITGQAPSALSGHPTLCPAQWLVKAKVPQLLLGVLTIGTLETWMCGTHQAISTLWCKFSFPKSRGYPPVIHFKGIFHHQPSNYSQMVVITILDLTI